MTALRKNRGLTVMRLIWLLYAVSLFIATHIPIPEGTEDLVSTYDKLLHGTAYFLLAVLSGIAFLKRESSPAAWLLLCGLLLAYGILDEFLQGFVNRTPDLEDWLSDATGVVVGCIAVWLGRRWLFSNTVSDAPQ